MLDHLKRIFAHVAWADMRALESLRAAPATDERAVGVLAHVLAAEELWLARLEHRTPDTPVWPELDLDACEALARAVHVRFERYVDKLTDDDLDRLVRYHTSAGVAYESHVGDILLHVALHGSYHRGQISMAVRDAGETPLYTDYIAYVRGGAPATSR